MSISGGAAAEDGSTEEASVFGGLVHAALMQDSKDGLGCTISLVGNRAIITSVRCSFSDGSPRLDVGAFPICIRANPCPPVLRCSSYTN